MDKRTLLKQYFGHGGFRPGQESLVDALLSGRDAVGVMPTGAGKSVCYQLPALLLPGMTLVISPLISLMKDQVTALAQAGVPAAYINSSLDAEAYREVYRQVRRGECKLLYVAPERLQAEGFRRLLEEIPISLVAVDEAHCVSQWGQDFRPSYLEIAELVRSLPVRPPVGAFTATATAAVRQDIETLLELREPLRVTTGFDRPNLFFEVVRAKDKDRWLSRFLMERPGQSGIVYCSTRKTVDAVYASLLAQDIPAARYHAGMEDEERRQSQEAFVYDQVREPLLQARDGLVPELSEVVHDQNGPVFFRRESRFRQQVVPYGICLDLDPRPGELLRDAPAQEQGQIDELLFPGRHREPDRAPGGVEPQRARMVFPPSEVLQLHITADLSLDALVQTDLPTLASIAAAIIFLMQRQLSLPGLSKDFTNADANSLHLNAVNATSRPSSDLAQRSSACVSRSSIYLLPICPAKSMEVAFFPPGLSMLR